MSSVIFQRALPVITSVALAFVFATDVARGENYALLVAVGDYDVKELRPLKYTRADVLEFQRALVDSGFAPKNVVLMHDDLKRLVAHYEQLGDGRDPKNFVPLRANIGRQLELLLGRLRPDDSVIVAFSGHGVQFKGDKKSFFCPSDAKLEDKDSLVAFDDVFAALKDCAAARKLFLVDACQNDPLSTIAKSRSTVDLESVTRPQTTAVPEGIIALFSCKAGQKSYELPELGHGVFFHHLLEGWKGKGDLNADGRLSYQELAVYTEKQTAEFAAVKLQVLQTPQLKAEFSGEWVLRDVKSVKRAALPEGPKGSALRWLSVGIHEPSAFDRVADEVNLIEDRSWQTYGDALAASARKAGKTLIAAFHRKEFPAIEPKLFDFVRRNRDVVAGVCFLSPYTATEGFGADRQNEFGLRLKKEFPGISYWVSYIEMPGGMQEPLPPVPPAVDVVTVDNWWQMKPEQVTEDYEKWLPAWIKRAEGRPLVLKWESRPLDWKPEQKRLTMAPGTLLKFVELAIKNKAAGVCFEHYGTRPDQFAPGLETDPTALREFLSISRTHGFGEQGFTSIFNGRDFTGWWVDRGDRTAWAVRDGSLVMTASPQDRGWLMSDREYGDFAVRFEFQVATAGANSGFTFHADRGEGTYGPNSLPLPEIQLQDETSPNYATLPAVQKTGALWKVAWTRTATLAPLGEWNVAEVQVRQRQLTVTINGVVTTSAQLGDLPAADLDRIPGLRRNSGRIGFQNWEGTFRFRDIRAKAY